MASEVILPPSLRRTNDDEDQIAILKREMSLRQARYSAVESMTREFTENLFNAFEANIHRAIKEGVPNLGEPRRIAHPAKGWRQMLQLFIEDWSVIFVPLIGAAWASPRDEAKINGARFKEPCGRVAVFWADDPTETSFYDFLIFAEGFWFAWGYGWPRSQDTLDTTNYVQITQEMLVSFIRDIHTTWRSRSETTLGSALDVKRRAYRFGRPGEE